MELNPLSETDLLRRLAQIHIPKEIAEATTSGAVPTDGHQVARVSWDGEVFFFITRDVSPTSIEGWFADTNDAAAPWMTAAPESTALDLPLMIDPRRVVLPPIVFDATFGAVVSELIVEIEHRDAASAVANTDAAAADQPHSLKTLITAFHALRGGAGTMADLLPAHGFDLATLKKTLGIDSPLAFALLRGDEALTPDQESLIVGASDIDRIDLAAAGPAIPEEVATVLREHQYRSAVSNAAETEGGGESRGWSRIARGALGLAARAESRTNVNWRDRVERFIETAGL
jgi:hypothetical protein